LRELQWVGEKGSDRASKKKVGKAIMSVRVYDGTCRERDRMVLLVTRSKTGKSSPRGTVPGLLTQSTRTCWPDAAAAAASAAPGGLLARVASEAPGVGASTSPPRTMPCSPM